MNSPFPNTTVGKATPPRGLQRCQRVVWSSRAQIFLECACGDSIAIIPDKDVDRNRVVDSISDEAAAEFFKECGWTIYDGKKDKTRCPKCKKGTLNG